MRDDARDNKDEAFAALGSLCELRAFERRHLPFVRTLEERDLICAIGQAQAAGKPLTMKEAFLLGLGSVATVQRRLRHLKRHGAIQQKPCEHDRRVVELLLAPKLLKAIATASA
jgi:hypothetical protein